MTRSRPNRTALFPALCLVAGLAGCAQAAGATRLEIDGTRWLIDGSPVNPGSAAEGLLMNVRMVNATFEDTGRPGIDAEANTDKFIAQIGTYAECGVNAFTLNLQGGMPGYEGAVNSAFRPDGSLRQGPLDRVRRVIEACDRHGVVVILGLYYQRQSNVLRDEAAVRAGVVNALGWVRERGFGNVAVEIANEHPHPGFVHDVIRDPEGMASLIRLAKETAPDIPVTASGLGDGRIHDAVAQACDFLTPHWNGTRVEDIRDRVAALERYGKPVVCNEDDKTGPDAVAAMRASVASGCAYGLMLNAHNQTFPFAFDGAGDDPAFYAALRETTSPPAPLPAEGTGETTYFPPPESQGGWRKLEGAAEVQSVAGMDPEKLARLRDWLLASDDRPFAAVVIRGGWIALQVERGNSASTDSRRIASVSKAVCATVLAIASERSRRGLTPRQMTFEDRAFAFIPWALPLSDPRKADITVKQLLNHTSGLCPEAAGAPNDGSWDYILGQSGDPRTAELAFDPGTACGYSTHGLVHASLVCETVTGKPYDEFAVEALFRPLGLEKWWFQYYDGGGVGKKASHGIGLPVRELARIGYCMVRDGRWGDAQIIPRWFVDETAAPTSAVATPELRWGLNPAVFSHGWELPARHFPSSGKAIDGIPADARYKPGSGGQLLAFVPSLDLVVARQTGSSGGWDYEEFLRRACDAVLPGRDASGRERAVDQPTGAPAPLFDGRSLEGWRAVPAECTGDWSVRDGAIVGTGSEDRLSYLAWNHETSTDFELALQYRLPGKGNSGIELRARPDPTGKRPLVGYHADLGHPGIGAHILGAWDFHFAERPEPPCPRGTRLTIAPDGSTATEPIEGALAVGDVKAGEWNHVRIVARGNTFHFYINGKLSSEFTDNVTEGALDRGTIALQIHDKGMRVEFKDIRLRPLTDRP